MAFSPGDVKVPLLVPEELADRLQRGDWSDDSDASDDADSVADATEARADSIADAAEAKADSGMARGMRAAARAREKGESLRRAGQQLVGSLHPPAAPTRAGIQRTGSEMAQRTDCRRAGGPKPGRTKLKSIEHTEH